MKKNGCPAIHIQGHLLIKYILMMKLGVVLILITSFEALAFTSFAQQRINIDLKAKTIPEVLKIIESSSKYRFLYEEELTSFGGKVDIYAKAATIDYVMQQLLENTAFVYKTLNKGLVVIVGTPQVVNSIVPIRGKITDTGGNPISGISIVEKGTSNGSTSDENGDFSINVEDENAILVITGIGYTTLEILVKDNKYENIVLGSVQQQLDEIVVVGYGTVKKSDLTGSVSQVKAKEVNAFPNANIIQALSGRAAGVQVNQSSGAPGPSLSVRIRGGNSIQGSNEPLYVIDGFPISGNSPNPSHINTSDIESIEILKDASSTAIYGSRGANGVILITTKRGKEGRTNVNLDMSHSSQKLIRKLDLMNAKEYASFYNEQAKNDKVGAYFSEDQIASFGEGYDWQELVFQKAPMKTVSLNINGGTNKTQFSLGGSYFDQDGIVIGSNYKRYSIQTNLNHKISEKFRVQFSGVLTKLTTKRKDSQGGSRGNSMISAAVSAPPTLTPYNDDGAYRVLHTNPGYQFLATDIRNPINFIKEQNNSISANVILLNTSLLYNITPDLIFKISGGIENRDDRTDNYTTKNFYNSQGIANVSTTQNISLLNENTLNYTKTFRQKHALNVLAGLTYQDFKSTSLSAGGVGFLSDIFETYNLGGAAIPGVPNSGYSKSVILSYLGRINYVYDDRYLLTASIRRDGSSRYSDGLKWGIFPSAALAWRISKESFLVNSHIISDLKMRSSWGRTGSQAIDPYMTLNTLFSGRTIFDNNYVTTFAPGTRYPGKLQWETTDQIDFGLDFGFLQNRALFTLDYYIKNTSNLLSTVLLPSSMGYTNTTQNIGKIQNKGFELSLDTKILTGVFRLDLSGNIAFNRNKVIKLYNGEDILRDNINVVVINDATSILREGQPVGRFWGYLEDGYNDVGDIIFRDLNNDKTISSADKTYIGDPNPNYIYGLNTTMSFKNFELNLFFQGMQGNDIFNASAITNTMDHGFGLNMIKDVYDNHWTVTNTNAKYPRISRGTPVRVSNRFIEDGSYLRLKNIMFSYNLPVAKLGVNWVRSFQIYVSGQNLWTLTNYSWWDPETNYRLDYNSYPLAKSTTLGIRVDF